MTKLNHKLSFHSPFFKDKMGGIGKMLLLVFMVGLVSGRTPIYNVLDYGAVGSPQNDDTQSFLKAWEAACSDEQSPSFLIPPSKTFFLNQIEFQGPCKSNIHVQIMGNLVAPNRIWTTVESYWISFNSINNLTIDGSGTIDGLGSIWWNCKNTRRCHQIPHLLGILNSQDVAIAGLHLMNSPGTHLEIFSSFRVHVSHLNIAAPEDSPNTDGIVIGESQHVEVTDCTIGTGDDCIAIGTGSSDVNITRITCGPGHGISVGSLGGKQSDARVENIWVYNCSFHNTMFGARIKTWQGGSGFARSISYEKMEFDSVTTPILIDQYYCNGEEGCPNSTSAVQVSDVSFVDARGTTSGELAIKIACSESVACKGITLGDINITSTPGPDPSTYCLNALVNEEGRIKPQISCKF